MLNAFYCTFYIKLILFNVINDTVEGHRIFKSVIYVKRYITFLHDMNSFCSHNDAISRWILSDTIVRKAQMWNARFATTFFTCFCECKHLLDEKASDAAGSLEIIGLSFSNNFISSFCLMQLFKFTSEQNLTFK